MRRRHVPAFAQSRLPRRSPLRCTIALGLAAGGLFSSGVAAQVPAEAGRDILVIARPDHCAPRQGPHGRSVPDAQCLSQALADRLAQQRVAPTPHADTPRLATPSRVGTFSHTATGQRMGRNFGHSAHAFRPGGPVHRNIIVPAGRP